MTDALPEAAKTQTGHPILVFLNTVSDDGKTRESNTFASGQDLLDQLIAGGLRTNAEAPSSGQIRSIVVLREAGYAVLSAIAAGRRPGHEDALVLEDAIKSAIADATFSPGSNGMFLPSPMGGLHDVLALGLHDLLQSPDLARLRECRRCTHLFLDHGRGPGRRWCSMARCGNRAKAQGFRDRRRAAG